VTFDHVVDLEDVAMGLRRDIAEENHVLLERSGADVRAEFGASATEQSGERRKVLALIDNFAGKSHCRTLAASCGDLSRDLDEVVSRAVEESKVACDAVSSRSATARRTSSALLTPPRAIEALRVSRRAARFVSLIACEIASSGVGKCPLAISALNQASWSGVKVMFMAGR